MCQLLIRHWGDRKGLKIESLACMEFILQWGEQMNKKINVHMMSCQPVIRRKEGTITITTITPNQSMSR